jgi:MYXO-CTERM domain-containing protein
LKGPPQRKAEQKVTCYASYEEEHLGPIVFEPPPDRPPPAFGMGLVLLCVASGRRRRVGHL